MIEKTQFVKMTEQKIQEIKSALHKKGWPPTKWVLFCETMLRNNFQVSVWAAKTTVSKYVYVIDKENLSLRYKVRFSNHKPSANKEMMADCDFFVGITNFKTTTTADAIRETLAYFNQNTGTRVRDNVTRKENKNNEKEI